MRLCLAKNPPSPTIVFSNRPELVTTVPTVSDAKRAFYRSFTRPINPLYRRVIEEMLVEMHLLSVNSTFAYDPIYALGVVTTYDTFMQGYQPTADVLSMFNALCQALHVDPEQYRRDEAQVIALATEGRGGALVRWLSDPVALTEAPALLRDSLHAIAARDSFKYSRLFAIGLFTLLETAEPELIKDREKLQATVEQISTNYHLPAERLLKDLDLYRSNLEKMAQAREVMEEAIQAERRKRDQREQEKLAPSPSTPEDTPSQVPDSPPV